MLKPFPALRFERATLVTCENNFRTYYLFLQKQWRTEGKLWSELSWNYDPGRPGGGLFCIVSVDEVSESLPSYHTAPDSIKTPAASVKKCLVFWRLCVVYCPTTLPSLPTSDVGKELPSPSEQNCGGQCVVAAWQGSGVYVSWVTKVHLVFCQFVHHAIWRH